MALADQRCFPPRSAEQIDKRRGLERKRNAVVANAMERREAPGHQRGAVGLADWARNIEAIERNTAGGERIDRGCPDGPISIAAQVVGTQLIGDEEKNVGAFRHWLSVIGRSGLLPYMNDRNQDVPAHVSR